MRPGPFARGCCLVCWSLDAWLVLQPAAPLALDLQLLRLAAWLRQCVGLHLEAAALLLAGLAVERPALLVLLAPWCTVQSVHGAVLLAEALLLLCPVAAPQQAADGSGGTPRLGVQRLEGRARLQQRWGAWAVQHVGG